MDAEPSNSDAGSGKEPSKDPERKDDKIDEDLSEEESALKQQLELYVEQVQDVDHVLQRVALEIESSMASNKSRNPKLPPSSSLKRSMSDESSLRRNSKRPSIESSQIGVSTENQDEIFRPWRSLSTQLNDTNEESEEVNGLSDISQMEVYQALSAEPNSARAFLACSSARHALWLKVKFGNEIFK